MKNKLIRITSIVLALTMLMPLLAACKKKEPDEDEIMDENYYIKLQEKETVADLLIDFSAQSFIIANPELRSRLRSDFVFEDEAYSLQVNGNQAITIKAPLITEWTEYNTLRVSIYSVKATNTTMQLRFSNPSNGSTSMAPYYRFPFTVDWTGWKTFDIELETLSGNYSPNYSDMETISVDVSGWGLTSSAENILYLGNMYLVTTEYEIISEVPLDDPAIYDKVKNQWREYLVGSPETGVSRSAEYTAKVNRISSNCKTRWDAYKSSGRNPWGITVTHGTAGEEVKIGTYYEYVRDLAFGYATVGSEYYHNSELLEDIKDALDHGYENFYGQNVIEDGTYGNWWWWDIGVPLILVEILMVLETELGTTAVKQYLEAFDYLDYYPSLTACNKIWIAYCCFASAFLQNDAERILISKLKLNDVFDYVNSSDGFYTDGSFVQHGNFSYTGGYGLSMLDEVTKLMLIMRGSRFDFIEENVKNQYDWLFNSYETVIYDGNFFASTRGREVDRNTSESSAQRSAVSSMIEMTTYAPAEIKGRLESLIRYYMLATEYNYANDVPLMLIDYAVGLYGNSDVSPREGYELVKVFGNMDRVVQHGPEYGVCLSLSSTRIFKYEAINNENMDGWYQGDGMLYIYTDGYDYNYSFFNYVDPYKLPGTTVSTATRTVENISGGLTGSSPFVGGVEAGKYGLAVFELGYAQNNYYNSNITARKSYFLFDNEIVAVGSGISESSGNMIRTIIENRLWRDSDVLTVNGSAVSPLNGTEYDDTVKTMHFTNMGGYVFLEDTDVTYKRTTSFLEIWTDHGVRPQNATYAYIYLPEATSAETESYSQSPDVEILTLNDTVHVVRENKLNVTGYAFYGASGANGVTASAACAVMVSVENGQTTITFSDPSHELTELTLTLELPGAGSVVSADSNVNASVENGTVTINASISGNVGQTYTVIIK